METKDKPLYHTVAQAIGEQIETGVYAPGSRLPGERHLAEEFSVSRVTIRQAIATLQALGHVDTRKGSGAWILDATPREQSDLPRASAFEVTEARRLFEPEVAALAALNIDDETLEQLAGYMEEMTSQDPEDEAAERADRDFHLAIATATGNSAASHIVELLWRMRTELPDVKEVYDAVCHEDASARGLEHAEIFDALKARDPGEARLAMRRHFTRLLESMLSVTEQQALQEIRRRADESRQRFLKAPGI
ncbi:MAG: FadR/GntR family transcriptional regulator [Gammaproteobacteria bacterium]|nr:FadR/GntR family transcriptional regulator [Gammaproteobacteria bacterium]